MPRFQDKRPREVDKDAILRAIMSCNQPTLLKVCEILNDNHRLKKEVSGLKKTVTLGVWGCTHVTITDVRSVAMGPLC